MKGQWLKLAATALSSELPTEVRLHKNKKNKWKETINASFNAAQIRFLNYQDLLDLSEVLQAHYRSGQTEQALVSDTVF